MMPQVNLEASTIDRMKQYAEPLVDTLDSVILKGLDAIDMLAAKTSDRMLNPASPPNLAYTTVKAAVLKGKHLPAGETYWNQILLAVVREAATHMTTAELDKNILCNHAAGKKEDNGYKFLEDVGLSIQGQDANNAWKSAYHLIKTIKLPVEVTFVWQDNPKAVSPGATGKFNITWE